MSSVFIVHVYYEGSGGPDDEKSYILDDCFTSEEAAENRIVAIETEAKRLDSLTPPPPPAGSEFRKPWLTNHHRPDDTNLYWTATFDYKSPTLEAVPTMMRSLDRSRWAGTASGCWRQDRYYNYQVEELNLVR